MKKISIELLQKIANYLANRPYIETFELINEIQRLEDVVEVKETDSEKPKKS